MKRKLTLFLVFCALSIISCGIFSQASPEEALLEVFKEELKEIKNAEQFSYANYMQSRDLKYESHQKSVNELIEQINTKFDSLKESDRPGYQTHWREKFQPVVEEIYTRTHDFVARETRDLTPEKMARIKELSIRHKALEKALPQTMLKPKFFILPEDSYD